MSYYGSVLQQGSFTVPATIVNRVVVVPAGVDWMWVYNYTQFGTDGGADPFGFRYYWQRGMAPGTGTVEYKSNGAATVNADTLLSGGFTLYDPSGQTPGALALLGNPVATTASTNATRPVVSTADTSGISVGTVVRLSNTAQTDVNGVDMVVGAVTLNTSFTLLTATNPLATAPGAIGGAGFYRIVRADSLFYPRRRYVVKITQAVNAQVSFSVEHSLTPGQEIRFSIPAQSGMIQLNPTPENRYLSATVVSVVDAYNITIDVDTTAFTPFTWPTIAQMPCQFPEMVPVGEDTGASILSPFAQTPLYQGEQVYNSNTGLLADSTVNTGFLGMLLGTGGDGNALGSAITGPAGSVEGDVVYWVAGKSAFGGS